jgi:hypothetical protein
MSNISKGYIMFSYIRNSGIPDLGFYGASGKQNSIENLLISK